MIRGMWFGYEQACGTGVMSKPLRSVNTLDVRWQAADGVAGCWLLVALLAESDLDAANFRGSNGSHRGTHVGLAGAAVVPGEAF